MSLINQMLKDLENRSSSHIKQKAAFVGICTTQLRNKTKMRWELIAFISIIGLCLFVILKIVSSFLTSHKAHPAIPISIHSTAHSAVSNPAPPSVPSVLTGLTMQIQNNKTTLRFLLTQDTLYRIDLDKKNNLLLLFLDHAHFISSLPPVNYTNSGIHFIEMLNLPNGDLKIIIGLKPEIELNKIEPRVSNKFPELQLELIPETCFQETTSSGPQNIISGRTIKKLIVNMSAEGEYQRALHLFSKGEMDNALLVLRELIVKYPTFNVARQLLVRSLVQLNHENEATLILEKGIQIQPNYIPFLEMRARLLADHGKPQAALDLLQKTHSPSLAQNPTYYELIAALYQRTGESMMSAKLYEQLIRLDPTRAIWWLGFGIALESLNKKSEALQAYNKANEAQGLTPELQAFVTGRINQA